MDSTTAPLPPRLEGKRQPDLPISAGAKKSKKASGGPKVKWVAAGVLTILVGVLGALYAVNVAGDRVNVLALTRNVAAGEKITAQDLTVSSFAEDPALSPVPASERATVIGQRAAVDLRANSMLTRSQLRAGGALGDDKQLVGVEVKRGQAPREGLLAGDAVLAVVLPAQGEETASDAKGNQAPADPETVKATVVSVGRADATGSVTVNLAVPTTDGPRLAMKAAAKQVALVREPRS
ncbi:SAF domain-containing protein [Streptomyces sp. NBC_01381]|uniref:SAF domain-containing protein n=1 Tax=Streptomyces sp. NBC_01381 TaxID=2903845 RepID=UPI0022516112|nr:SAF domain-containing protein [Streptomyces sp. NBC_01381]MCX4673649.1 SAF domain-containing protein [Streptomyces sp. NBC_01381]